MWLFLITEILFFSGLFVAYAVFRSRHPEVFADAHLYLDKTLGAVNTVVLLFSSLTMAWAVRCAQLNQRRGLIACLITTLACASLFLGIKAIEYAHKWDTGLFWAGAVPAAWRLSCGPRTLAVSAGLVSARPAGPARLHRRAASSPTQAAAEAPDRTRRAGADQPAFFVGVGCAMVIPGIVAPWYPAPITRHADGQPPGCCRRQTDMPINRHERR
jgi:hypothetical protein